MMLLSSRTWDRRLSVHRRFANRPMGRRLIALAAAYAIVLSSLIVSFGVARAAVPAPGTITCHSDAGGAAAPTDGRPDGKLCDASCCTGCLMLVAALPPPPVKVAGAPRSFGQPLPLDGAATLGAAAHTTSHRSRAPPRAA
jgi:hypothetical protein